MKGREMKRNIENNDRGREREHRHEKEEKRRERRKMNIGEKIWKKRQNQTDREKWARVFY